jgi:hypothetical protein
MSVVSIMKKASLETYAKKFLSRRLSMMFPYLVKSLTTQSNGSYNGVQIERYQQAQTRTLRPRRIVSKRHPLDHTLHPRYRSVLKLDELWLHVRIWHTLSRKQWILRDGWVVDHSNYHYHAPYVFPVSIIECTGNVAERLTPRGNFRIRGR